MSYLIIDNSSQMVFMRGLTTPGTRRASTFPGYRAPTLVSWAFLLHNALGLRVSPICTLHVPTICSRLEYTIYGTDDEGIGTKRPKSEPGVLGLEPMTPDQGGVLHGV